MRRRVAGIVIVLTLLASVGCGSTTKTLQEPTPDEVSDGAAEQACWDYYDARESWKLYPPGSKDLIMGDLQTIKNSAAGSDDMTLRITVETMILAAADRRAEDFSKDSYELGRICAAYLAKYLN